MPEMIATSEIEYPPGKQWHPGDRFQVEDDHAILLQKLGRAKLPEQPPKETQEPPRNRGRNSRAR